MRTQSRDVVRGWLEAEAAGREDEADLAFAAVAVSLPRLQPSRRFLAQVMTRVAPGKRPFLAPLWTSWWARAAVAASLATLGAVAGTMTWSSAFLATVTTAQTVGRGFSQAMAGSRAWLEALLTLWSGFSHAGVVLGRLLLTPGPAMLVTVNLALAICAMAALQRLLATQENR